MKKLLISIFVFFLIVEMSHAQFFSLGLKAGGQFTNANTNSDDTESSGIIGYHAGAFFKVKTPLKIGVKTEVLYSQRGADFTTKVLNQEVKTEFRASYIDIPLLITFNIIKPLTIEFGPQLSILNNEEFTENGVKIGYSTKSDPEFGFALGVDFNLPKKLGVYARYNHGYNRWVFTAGDSKKLNKSWIQLGLKYRIFEPI